MSTLLIVSDYIFDYSKLDLDKKVFDIHPDKQSQSLIPLRNIRDIFTTEDEETTINIVGHNNEVITTLVVLGKEQVNKFMLMFAEFENGYYKDHCLKVSIKVTCVMENLETGQENVSIHFEPYLIPIAK